MIPFTKSDLVNHHDNGGVLQTSDGVGWNRKASDDSTTTVKSGKMKACFQEGSRGRSFNCYTTECN
jgi:hypothetical protein